MVISCLAALFDPYVAIALLDDVVNVTKDKKDDGATRFDVPDVAIGALSHRWIENVGYVGIWTTFPVLARRETRPKRSQLKYFVKM